MKLRVLAIALAILAFFIFVGSPFQQAANAVVGADDAILLIILAALASMGITFTMTGGINTVLSWLSEQIQDAGLDFSGIRYGANNQGQILMNNRFLILVSTLALYIKVKLGLTDNSSVTIQESGTVAGSVYAYRLPIEFVGNYGDRYILLSSSPDAYVFFNYTDSYRDSVRPIAFAFGENAYFSYLRYDSWGGGSTTYQSSQANGGYYVFDQNNIDVNPNHDWSYSNAFNGIVVHSYDIDYSNIQEFLQDNVFGTGISQTNELIANAGEIDIPDGQEIEGNGGIITLPVPWGETLPGAIEVIPGLTLTDELEGNVDLDIENESDIADQISQEATNAQVVSDQPGDYQVNGLTTVFPFCIPFDLYNFVACLAADPVAPSFTWRFYVPGICDESIEIDLSEFNAAAQVLRTMELLLFCVGLAFVTRKIIRG